MHEPLLVRVFERRGDVLRQPDGLGDRQRAVAIEPRPQRSAGDMRHHVIQPPGLGARIVKRKDVRVRQPGDGFDLAKEPFRTDRLGRLGLHDLQRDAAPVLRIVRQIHRGHSALAQGGKNGVGAELHP